jgi:hypothetical protein
MAAVVNDSPQLKLRAMRVLSSSAGRMGQRGFPSPPQDGSPGFPSPPQDEVPFERMWAGKAAYAPMKRAAARLHSYVVVLC